MRFLTSIADAFLDRSPSELIGALMIAGAIALFMAGLYALGRRKTPCSPTVVGCLALAAGLSCMTVAAGYIEYSAEDQFLRSKSTPPMFPPWASTGRSWNSPAVPLGFYGSGWSSGIHFVVAADEDRNGRLSLDEATQLMKQADTDGDGLVDFRDIDRVIANRIRPQLPPPVESSDKIKQRTGAPAPIEHHDRPSELSHGAESFQTFDESVSPEPACPRAR